MKKTSIIIAILCIAHHTQAQLFKDLDKRLKRQVERQVERKIERKTQEKTDQVLDKVFDGKKSKRRNSSGRNGSSNENTSSRNSNGSNNQRSSSSRTGTSAKDFIPGQQVVFQETFSRDQIGDFPGTWNTNSSGEVITFSNDNAKWLKMLSKGVFTPDGLNRIPDNSTIEFDITVDDNTSFYSHGLVINIVELKNRTNSFTQWTRFKNGKNGVSIRLVPNAASSSKNEGRTEFANFVNGKKIVSNKKAQSQFTRNGNTVHVGLWRQKGRLRMYLNDQKVWDIPRAFASANYNGLVFTVDTKGESYYVSNIRVAKAGADTRHKLLETGIFSTNDILFQSGSSTLMTSSNATIQELVNALNQAPNRECSIIGHTDSDGETDANMKLSRERAYAVKERMIKMGVKNPRRLSVFGKGENEPIASNNSAAGKKQNRRVEFKLN